MQPEATTQAVERAKEPRPYFDSPEEKFIESTGDFPINFPENLDEFTFPEKEKPSSGASIGPGVRGGWRHPIAWLDELEGDIRHGTGETWPGRILRTMGAKGIESGVSPGVAEMVGGPAVGPVKALRGVLETPTHPIRGVNEVIGGTLQTASPFLGVTQPEFLPVATAYSVGSNVAQKGLQKLGVNPEDAEFIVNAVALGGGYVWSVRAKARAEAIRQRLQDAKVDTLSNEERQAVQRLANALPSPASAAVEPRASQVATGGLPSLGEQVILSNGQRAKVVSVVPNLNRVVLRTRSGLKTVTAADIRWRGPQPAGLQKPTGLIAQSSGLTAGSQIGPIQFKAGDYVQSLKDGRDGIVERILPRLGLAQVRTGSSKLQAVRLSKLAHRLVAQTEEWEAATYDIFPIRKGQPTQQEAAILGKAPRRPAQASGAARDFQIKTCGPIETLIQGGGEEVWADDLKRSDGMARDAKYVRKVNKSMYVEGSKIDPEFRGVLERRTVEEFRRYAAVIQDPKSPIRALEVIVSDRASVSYFLKLMKRFGIPGHIVIKIGVI